MSHYVTRTGQQLWLPFVGGHDERRKNIAHYVKATQPILKRMKINPAKVGLILTMPDAFWRPITLTKANRVCYITDPILRKIHVGIMWYIKRRIIKKLTNGIWPATAFGKHHSILRNALYHYANRSSLVLDVADAFHSVKTKHVYHCLKRYVSEPLAWIFSQLVTFQGRLRQGASVSPIIFNLVMIRFDKAMIEATGACRTPHFVSLRQNRWMFDGPPHPFLQEYRPLVYTRYGDDLCFSSPLEDLPTEIEPKVREVVSKFGLKLNKKRKIGKNGILELPGVRIVRGQYQPDINAIVRCAQAIATGAPPATIHGYLAFFNQFPRRGRRKAYDLINRMLNQTS